MVKSYCSVLLLVCITFLVIVSSPQNGVEADKLIGSCVWGAVDYTSNCNNECKRRGFRGGHCGSFANVNCCCSSEDESGATKTPSKSSTAHRRGARRVRRRRAMPIHCVTLQAPMPERCSMSDLSEKPKDVPTTGRLYKSSSEINCENLESQSTTSMAMTSTDPVDETWRGGYATAASRRRMMTACSWGNGVRWDRGIGRAGQWVRIYPHALPKDDQLSLEDARESVAHVSKLLRAAREVARESGRDKSAPRDGSRDTFLEDALRKKLQYGSTFEIWLPPF